MKKRTNFYFYPITATVIIILGMVVILTSSFRKFDEKKNSSGFESNDPPEKVAEMFLNHMAKKEFVEAKKLATPTSAELIDMMDTLSKNNGKQSKESIIEIQQCKIDGDKAVCNYKENGEPSQIALVKIDGKWLVDFKKETPDLNSADTTKSTNH